MINIESIFLFFYIFSWVCLIRLAFKTVVLLIQTPPQRLSLERNELIFYATIISYIITYFIQN
jgi:hypothetical protein